MLAATCAGTALHKACDSVCVEADSGATGILQTNGALPA